MRWSNKIKSEENWWWGEIHHEGYGGQGYWCGFHNINVDPALAEDEGEKDFDLIQSKNQDIHGSNWAGFRKYSIRSIWKG